MREILRRAGDAALARFRRSAARMKADGTEVTDADKAAEEALVEGLLHAFPGHGIRGEEGAHVEARPGEPTWWLDPIDGTGAFVEELSHWGPTVCMVRDGTLVAGGLWFPRVQEFWFAERGAGAWRDGIRLRPIDPSESTGDIARHHSLYLPSRYHRRMPIDWPGKVRALGSSAAHLAQVACGGGVATVIPRWELWDVGCGLLLVEEAGRFVTTLTGGPLDPVGQLGEPFVAGTPAALSWLSRQIRVG